MSICSICLDECKDAVSGSCIHRFCRSCISEWLNNNYSCPECRNEITFLNSLPLTKGSLLKNIGLENIHSYSAMFQDGLEIVKGQTPNLTREEKEYICTLSGFKVDGITSLDNNDDLICVLSSNIITIGKKNNINNTKYKIIDGVAIVRDNRTTFPISPSIREYSHRPDNIYYKLVI